MKELTYVNADVSQHVVVDTNAMEWEASPSSSVWRKPLYRDGGEFAAVTSIVRYDAGGEFRTHAHPQGEEILVLEGEFCDDHGRYPAGSYLLNPDGSKHAPYSDTGCVLFVRLRQYDGDDREQKVIQTKDAEWMPGPVEGISISMLYAQDSYPENMLLARFEPGAKFPKHDHPGGEEIFVLEGTLEDENGRYPAGTWLRNPDPSSHEPFSTEGCLLYVRSGGLNAA